MTRQLFELTIVYKNIFWNTNISNSMWLCIKIIFLKVVFKLCYLFKRKNYLCYCHKPKLLFKKNILSFFVAVLWLLKVDISLSSLNSCQSWCLMSSKFQASWCWPTLYGMPVKEVRADHSAVQREKNISLTELIRNTHLQ